MSILIKDADWILTQNRQRKIIRNKSILIDKGKILQIGEKISSNVDYVIDGQNKAVLPGLINTHTHLSMTLLRGYADDLRLQEWLETKIWPLELRLTGELCYTGGLLGCLEMIKTGTTCFLDMYYFTENVARAAADSGLRAFTSHAIIDLLDKSRVDDQITKAKMTISSVKALNNSRVRIAISPHSPYTCTDESLLAAKELAISENAPLHTHLAETRKEQTNCENKHGKREVEHLEKIGFLCPNLVAAHCVWLTKQEICLFSKNHVKVSHCPVSNMKLAGGGVAPLIEFFNENVTVSLGTDGAASNNCLDMFDTMKTCALLHKAHRWDPTVLSAQKTLDLATIDGARALGIAELVGSIEEGKSADIILLNLRSPNLQPIHGERTILSNAVYSAQGSDVDTTIVEGQILMQDRKMLSLDEPKIYREANEAAQRLIKE